MHKFDLAYTIDDDEITSYLTDQVIRNCDTCQTMESYTNGQTAMERLKQVIENNGKLPDLILLDLSMPVMNGWEFLNAYRELHLEREIPLFVLSSSIDPGDLQRTSAYKEVKGFIAKPLNREKLEKMVQACS